MMLFRSWLFFGIALGVAAISYSATHAENKAPNLIVIMADDLGYADVGFNGCRDIPTPHIDSIAHDGIRFSNGYVAYAVCGPSRAAFMTGRYGQRFGFERNPQYQPNDPNMGLPASETTLAETLSAAGYRCGVVGKWHLGAHETHHPLKRGFHEFFGHLGGGHTYFPELLTIRASADARDEAQSYRTWILNNHTPVRTTGYLTDEFSEAAVRFVQSNAQQPFFLYLAYNAPHTPLQATEKYLARFPDLKGKRKTYAAMVSAVDDGVGQVLKKLRELKIDNNTLVFFLSDNGGPTTKNASSNNPLRGNKGDIWEGGFRVPFAVRWPAGLPRGKVFDRPVSSLDIFATIAACNDIKQNPDQPLDGVNLVPFLTGQKPGSPHESIYLRQFDAQRYAIRKGSYKLVIPFRNAAPRLFDLDQDIAEKTDLAADEPQRVQMLKRGLDAWTANLIEPRFDGLKLRRSSKQKNNSKPNADAWKKNYFKNHPKADANQDGTLTWAELKAYREKFDPPPKKKNQFKKKNKSKKQDPTENQK